mmetsp:Transcript_2208/g.8013  ORF Transcript_2208/g.8013 Transcript_2208/m.8013 type:complete len:349 (+) Transcript_2208:80-1126(+)
MAAPPQYGVPPNQGQPPPPPQQQQQKQQEGAKKKKKEASAGAGKAAPNVSCKLDAVIRYLRDLRERCGGIDPTAGKKGGKGAAGGASKADAAAARRALLSNVPGVEEDALTGKLLERGESIRGKIRSSDAALAAALPKLAPVVTAAGLLDGADGLVEKSIIFSQWTSMLDLLEGPLKKEGFQFRRLDGAMSLAARDKALMEFEEDPSVTVMLMSLKAAGLGVNLVCANHVLLLDVWWNPTVEEQAIDRCHRIGQRREVHVTRFTVKDTVEDQILKLQAEKRALAASAFGEDADGCKQRIRLTEEDLVMLFSSKGAHAKEAKDAKDKEGANQAANGQAQQQHRPLAVGA